MQKDDSSRHMTPFAGHLSRDVLVESQTHDEALARLHYLVETRRRVGLLVGESGTGKSLVLQTFADELRRHSHVVAALNLWGLSEHDFVWSLAAELGINPRVDAPLFALWRSLSDRLAEHRYQQIATVAILDDVGEAEPVVLSHVVRLLNLEQAADTRMTIVLATNPGHVSRLGNRLLDLCQLRIDIDAWEPSETAEYLQRSLEKSHETLPAFDTLAATRLHDLASGNPRRINQLAHLAILANAADQKATIDQETIDAVYDELSVCPPAR